MASFDYDDLTDSLIVSKKKKTDKVKGSLKLGDFIIDITKLGKVIGLEIIGFSDFLKRAGIKQSIKEMVAADISVKSAPDSITVWFYIRFEDKEEKRLPIILSTEKAQMAEAA